jgi:hypothetical protein
VGKGCEAVKQAARDVWQWYFPREISPPDCVLALLRTVYPTVDWDSVTFHDGIPHVISTGQSAITLPDTYSFTGIGVYFASGAWDTCSEDGLATIVHEGMHVLQLQGAIGGVGLGFARPFIIQYLSCWAGHGFSYDEHPMEREAYRVAGCPSASPPRCPQPSLFEACYDASRPVCDCSSGSPVLNQGNLNAFAAGCPGVVQRASSGSFWENIARCVPGFRAIVDLAGKAFALCTEKTEGSVTVPVPTGPGPGPTDPTEPAPPTRAPETPKPGIRIPVQWLKCLVGVIGAGLLYLLAGVYYAVWTLLWTVVTIVLWVVKMVWELIGAIVTGILWVVAGIVCAAEWLWEKFKEGMVAACDWATNLERQCAEWRETRERHCAEEEDRGYQDCAREEDQGYSACAREEDRGYRDCCDWWPCSWVCDAWVWVSNVVCVAWTWVSNVVCVAWTWVSNVVCVAWTWVVSRTCAAFTWVVKGASCWAR